MRLGSLSIATYFSLAACSDLSVTQLKPDDSVKPLTGQMTYYLPRTVMSVSITLTVAACDGKGVAPVGAGSSPKPLVINAAMTMAAALEADPDYGYAIDYQAAQSWMKETQFALATGPGKLFGSLNASINDQAGPIAIATLTTAVQIAGAVTIPGVNAVKHRVQLTDKKRQTIKTAPSMPSICTDAVHDALDKAAPIQRQIASLKTKISGYYTSLAASKRAPAKEDPTTGWSQAVTALQAALAATQKPLTYSFTTRWIPKDFKPVAMPNENETVVATTQEFPVSDAIATFVAAGAEDRLDQKIRQPLLLKAVIDPATYFAPSGDDAFAHPSSGVMVRDPAVSLVQRCSVAPGNVPGLKRDAAGHWVFDIADKNSLCPTPSPRHATMSNGSSQPTDDSTRVQVTFPQFGRPMIYTAHSGLFGNAMLGLTMGSDGSITQVSTHDSATLNTAAAGIGNAAAAAGAAETARNTAVGAVNTALGVQVGLNDTINKSLADCLSQSAAAIKAGGRPVPCQ